MLELRAEVSYNIENSLDLSVFSDKGKVLADQMGCMVVHAGG